MTTNTNTQPIKLEEKRSSGFTITHEFKDKLHAVKYVSMETNIVEKDVAYCIDLYGYMDHKFPNEIEVTYKLVG